MFVKSIFLRTLIFLCLINCVGCSYLIKDYYKASLISTSQSSENISTQNKRRLQDLTIGVNRTSSGTGEQLVDILQKTHLFAKVDFTDNLKYEPDLFLIYPQDKLEDVLADIMGAFSQMIDYAASSGTFGILPSRAKSYEYDLEFSLKSKDGNNNILIPVKLKLTRVNGGWPFMTPLVLFQQWHLDENKALSKAFKKAIAKKEQEIITLVPR